AYTDWMIGSYLGLFNYSFSNKYYLDATYRREGSSRFPSANRWGNFWSVGAAWNIHNEDFMADTNLFSNLRLRGSYGINGNTGNGVNEYQSLLAYDADYSSQAGSYTSSYGNKDLTWEKNEILDLGLEFGFLDDKITGSFAYFDRTTKDLLLDVPLSFTTGSEEQIQNVGEMTNKGIELELNFDVIRSQDLNFSIGGNLATVENEVTKMNSNSAGEESVIESSTRKVEVGHAVYSWNMKKWAGVDPATGNPLWYVNGKDGETTGTYSVAEKAYQGGSALPTLTAGLNTHVDYKGFYLDANLYYAGGHKVYEDWAFYTYHQYYGLYYYQNVDVMMDRWQQPGDITDVPRLGTDSALNNSSSTSTRFLYDGDYIRLKDLVVGYTFPEVFSSKIGMTSVKAYVRGTNLFTWVKDDRLKYDPEVQASGFTRLSSPPTKSITVGFNFNF
uniref:TonB-dependent receptor domain-containing protein n=1 Tax=Lutibacter sp. TaxID=1925666 RepID=UPI003567E5BA